MTRSYDELLSAVQAAVRVAGESVVKGLTQEFGEVEHKTSIGDLVTQLDRDIEMKLQRELSTILPEAGSIGEEEGAVGEGRLSWVIDPIDGSTNVVHGLPHAAVSVALCEGLDPVLGVVRNPFVDETYFALRGQGAFAIQGGWHAVRLNVSRTPRLRDSLVSFGLPYDRSRTSKILHAAEHVIHSCQDLRRWGSASLDLIAVAMGRVDGHFELDLRLWDVAAAGLILQEAGGRLTDWAGKEVSWESAQDKLDTAASNGVVHTELLERLALTCDSSVTSSGELQDHASSQLCRADVPPDLASAKVCGLDIRSG